MSWQLDPVSRILSALRQDDHSSGPRIAATALATYPEVERAEPVRVPLPLFAQQQRNSFPIWSCSVWGLPCPRHRWHGGALLPHLFTLTPVPKNEGGMFSVALSVNRA